jgi:hypothetical protein
MPCEIIVAATTPVPHNTQRLNVLDPQAAENALSTLLGHNFRLLTAVASFARLPQGVGFVDFPVVVYTLANP